MMQYLLMVSTPDRSFFSKYGADQYEELQQERQYWLDLSRSQDWEFHIEVSEYNADEDDYDVISSDSDC
jgi:hypothetical protein